MTERMLIIILMVDVVSVVRSLSDRSAICGIYLVWSASAGDWNALTFRGFTRRRKVLEYKIVVAQRQTKARDKKRVRVITGNNLNSERERDAEV